MKKHYLVCAAIVMEGNKILCLQRNKSKYDYISFKYEFPGGKVEQKVTPDIALVREIQEELSLNITKLTPFLVVNHEYEDFGLTMHSFLCEVSDTNLVLHEHVDFKWLTKESLMTLDWAAADIPIVNKLMVE